jgi:hypothetical protein
VEAEPRRRPAFAFTDELWARLSDLGGNVKALHRWMEEHAEEVVPSLGTGVVPSLTTLYHAVHREQRAGRVLEISRPAHAHGIPERYDRALAELALPGTVDENGWSTAPAAENKTSESDGTPEGAGPALFGHGARLYVPGAHVVSTRQLGAVTEALAHTRLDAGFAGRVGASASAALAAGHDREIRDVGSAANVADS